MTAPQLPLGAFGVWRGRAVLDTGTARTVERLGFGTLWVGGSPGADLGEVEAMLDATERIVVATGIVNVWRAPAADTARSFHRIEQRHPGRLLLGVGSGHREADADRRSPLAAMAAYLDVLDAEGVPSGRRVVSALGPRMLQLARARSLGTHPYLTPPAHTRWAREAIGPDGLLAPEQTVIGETDASAARAIGRAMLERYLRLSNYAATIERWGFSASDLADGGSDGLVDALTVWGGPDRLAAALRAHLDAGASHVCAQVIPVRADPEPVLAALAGALGLP